MDDSIRRIGEKALAETTEYFANVKRQRQNRNNASHDETLDKMQRDHDNWVQQKNDEKDDRINQHLEAAVHRIEDAKVNDIPESYTDPNDDITNDLIVRMNNRDE